MFISLLYKKKKAGREKRESGLDRLTEGPNNHVQKAIQWEDMGAGARGGTKAKKNASRHRLGQAMEKHICRSYHTDLEVIDLGLPSTDLVLPGWEQRTGDTACKELQLSPLLHLADSQLLYKKDLSARKLAGRSFCGEAEMLLKVSQWNTASSWIQICVLNWEKRKRSRFECFDSDEETFIWRCHRVWNLNNRHRNGLKRACYCTVCFPGNRKEAHLLQHALWGYSNDGLWSTFRLHQIPKCNFSRSSFPSLLAMSCH